MSRYTTALLRGFLCERAEAATRRAQSGHRALAGGPTGRIGIAVCLGRSVKAEVEVIVSSSADSVAKLMLRVNHVAIISDDSIISDAKPAHPR